MGALAYADDLTLLCPSLHGLRSMLSTCESFGKEFDVKFNPKKSECMLFKRKKSFTRASSTSHLSRWSKSDLKE